MADDPQKTTDPTGEQPTEDAPGAGGQPAGGEKGGAETPPAEEKKFSQAELDRIVEERLSREKKKREEATQQAREKAEAEALAEQEKWKELAEKHGGKADKLAADLKTQTEQLEEATARIERVEAALASHLEAQKEGLPDPVLELLEKLDTVEQLEYLAKHKGSLSKNGVSGVPPTPSPAGEQPSQEERKKRSTTLRKNIRQWM